jgi:nitrogen fixation protein NifU and related proteins
VDDLYQQNILDHFKYPRHHGKLADATVVQEEHNPLCGDRLTLYLKVADGTIRDVSFEGRGCAISQAAASMLAEELVGKTTAEAKNIGKEQILDLLGIPIGPVRLKCALLSLKTLKAGLYGVTTLDDDDDLL